MQKNVFVVLRLSLSFIFLWAFFDKLFGLGFATTAEKAWIQGGSPTFGFLSSATKGPFVELFHGLAGMPFVDWLFMAGLLFIGVTLLINRFVVWGSIAGSAMLLLMYLSLIPPENNPIIDDHLVYIFVLILLAVKSSDKRNSLN